MASSTAPVDLTRLLAGLPAMGLLSLSYLHFPDKSIFTKT
jgi:hypothetical protein